MLQRDLPIYTSNQECKEWLCRVIIKFFYICQSDKWKHLSLSFNLTFYLPFFLLPARFCYSWLIFLFFFLGVIFLLIYKCSFHIAEISFFLSLFLAFNLYIFLFESTYVFFAVHKFIFIPSGLYNISFMISGCLVLIHPPKYTNTSRLSWSPTALLGFIF